jgi:hypothetical protein
MRRLLPVRPGAEPARRQTADVRQHRRDPGIALPARVRGVEGVALGAEGGQVLGPLVAEARVGPVVDLEPHLAGAAVAETTPVPCTAKLFEACIDFKATSVPMGSA